MQIYIPNTAGFQPVSSAFLSTIDLTKKCRVLHTMDCSEGIRLSVSRSETSEKIL